MNKNKIIITFIVLYTMVGGVAGCFIGTLFGYAWIGSILGGIACGIEFWRQIKTYK